MVHGVYPDKETADVISEWIRQNNARMTDPWVRRFSEIRDELEAVP